MKFGKEFVSQMVPEWQEAYMDYNGLKAVLKDVLNFRRAKVHPRTLSAQASTPGGSALKRRVSMYRAFSGLTGGGLRRSPNSPMSPMRSREEHEEEVILVNSVREMESSDSRYQTVFLMSSDEGGEYELVFFRRLDDEFNKVVGFYRKKVKEVVKEADELTRQMNALIALRIKVERPDIQSHGNSPSQAPENTHHPLPGIHPTGRPAAAMEAIQEVEVSNEDQCPEEEDSTRGNRKAALNLGGFRPAPLEVLQHVKIHVDPDTPISTVKGFLRSSNNGNPNGLSFNKSELKKAEERMIKAFVEFYQKLRLLKGYCFLNQTAFSKIMKKYDKITSRGASKSYLKMVDESFLGNSDEVNRLIERVEATFTKHFANGNRGKGMAVLRPTARRERHRITFLLGCFFGCSVALMVAVLLVVRLRGIFDSPGRTQYMDTIFPLYSLFGFIVLHTILYAGNVFFWRRYRINYSFIFGFKPGTEMNYRDILLLGSGLAVMTLAGVLSNLDMESDPQTKQYKAFTELVPLVLLIVVVILLFQPFNILYRSSRFFLLRCGYHCMLAPLYKVTLPDFFLGDQLTSQVQSFRYLEFYICYYGSGYFKSRSNKCASSVAYTTFSFIIAVIPFWFRFLQCMRRLVEEKAPMQGYNGLKYFSTIVALVIRTVYSQYGGDAWRVLASVTSGATTIFSTYWDIVIDWGLLDRNSKNRWLRDKLVIQNKAVYFVAMGLNVVLRLAWMQVVLGFKETAFLHRTAVVAIFACLEIIRRGIWNFFRLENEHLNNVGHYRAFKSVPLPFHHDEDDDDKRM
ncbi:hypothetical protein SAY86_007863 [Trapa natans]|uniref:Phosphate transporter PHO1-like protein n=1 Tax=Trapa natans TaxID=22666 RepID=A0AAN7LF84_TRANT|nr:hypothetical protein SAY86_007863 [Trapa natans]